MTKEFDKYQGDFKDVQDFFSFLYERERETKRVPIRTSDIKFTVLDNEGVSEDELRNKYSIGNIDTYKDTLKGTKLSCSLYRDYLLGESSWTSIASRVGIFGPGFKSLLPETKALVLNERFNKIGKIVLGVVTFDKVRAIMSDEYAVIPAADVFMKVIEKVDMRFQRYSLIAASANHNVTTCKIVFPELKETMSSLYGKDDYTPGLIIETSDTGFSANQVSAYWMKNSQTGFVNSSEHIYLKHIGHTNLDKILEQLPNMFLKYQNLPKKFAAMMQIKVYQPVDVFKCACKNIGIPKGLTGRATDQFANYLESRSIPTTTAYDICREILSIPALVDDRNIKDRMEELVGKAVNVNFEKIIKLVEEGVEEAA